MRVLTAILLCAALPSAAQELSGRRAPSFSLSDSALKQHDILDYRGRWLLIDFMRTDCPHCKAVSKSLEESLPRFAAKLAVLSIVISPPETQATVARYISENKITSPIVFDMGQVAISYFKATPARPAFDAPHVFAVDPNGTIVRDWGQGALENPSFLREVEQLVAGRKF